MPVFKQHEVFAGRYVLSQLVGEGGFSEVWKAKDQMADDAVVALKIYAPEKGLDDYGLRQFRKEFSLTYPLSHPHLLKIYHYDISEGSPYLIMPFCPFGSLSRILAEEGVFSERQVALALCQIGSALDVLHRQDPPILHQDIKPDNILVLHPEFFLLADFGISSQIRHTLRKATSNLKSLTVAYAPPERFDRYPTSDPSSDIFSFGVTLYEMCTNKIPWDGSGGPSLLKGAHIPHLPETYSKELNRILQSCMSVDRSKRPKASELHIRGRNYLETGNWKMPKKKNRKSSGRSFVPYLVSVVLLLVVVLGFGLYSGLIPGYKKGFSTIAEASVGKEHISDEQLLEEGIKNLEAQLMETNSRIGQSEPITKVMAPPEEPIMVKNERQAETRTESRPSLKEEKKEPLLIAERAGEEPQGRHENNRLQYSLNQISNPKISKKVRLDLKQEIISQFADESVVLDESSGAEKGISASIFLNLLLNVPHHVVIKEEKREANNKITELRLHMESY